MAPETLWHWDPDAQAIVGLAALAVVVTVVVTVVAAVIGAVWWFVS